VHHTVTTGVRATVVIQPGVEIRRQVVHVDSNRSAGSVRTGRLLGVPALMGAPWLSVPQRALCEAAHWRTGGPSHDRRARRAHPYVSRCALPKKSLENREQSAP
jgi:hypothetical protein